MSSPTNQRSAFTLVELLIAIAIIGIMSGMVMYTIAGAQSDAKRAKTQATISKINAVILQKFEEYRYRSVKISIPRRLTQRNFDPLTTSKSPPLLSARKAATIRAFVLKDTMRMEMPDRMTDLTYTPSNIALVLENGVLESLNNFGGRYCPREYNVLRNYFNLLPVSELYDATPLAVERGGATYRLSLDRELWTEEYAAEECLYAIVAHSMVDGGSALESFHPSEIGDLDGDSYPEFLDAWGNAIGWIRWPAAYPSQLNISYMSNPDAFDPYKTNAQWANAQKPWTLIPLIISGGADGDMGLAPYSASDPIPIYATPRTSPFDATTPSINPWYPDTGAPRVGQLNGSSTAAEDNITNHDIMLE